MEDPGSAEGGYRMSEYAVADGAMRRAIGRLTQERGLGYKDREGQLEKAFKAYCLFGETGRTKETSPWELCGAKFAKWCREAGIAPRQRLRSGLFKTDFTRLVAVDVAFSKSRSGLRSRTVDFATFRGRLIPCLAKELRRNPLDVSDQLMRTLPQCSRREAAPPRTLADVYTPPRAAAAAAAPPPKALRVRSAPAQRRTPNFEPGPVADVPARLRGRRHPSCPLPPRRRRGAGGAAVGRLRGRERAAAAAEGCGRPPAFDRHDLPPGGDASSGGAPPRRFRADGEFNGSHGCEQRLWVLYQGTQECRRGQAEHSSSMFDNTRLREPPGEDQAWWSRQSFADTTTNPRQAWGDGQTEHRRMFDNARSREPPGEDQAWRGRQSFADTTTDLRQAWGDGQTEHRRMFDNARSHEPPCEDQAWWSRQSSADTTTDPSQAWWDGQAESMPPRHRRRAPSCGAPRGGRRSRIRRAASESLPDPRARRPPYQLSLSAREWGAGPDSSHEISDAYEDVLRAYRGRQRPSIEEEEEEEEREGEGIVGGRQAGGGFSRETVHSRGRAGWQGDREAADGRHPEHSGFRSVSGAPNGREVHPDRVPPPADDGRGRRTAQRQPDAGVRWAANSGGLDTDDDSASREYRGSGAPLGLPPPTRQPYHHVDPDRFPADDGCGKHAAPRQPGLHVQREPNGEGRDADDVFREHRHGTTEAPLRPPPQPQPYARPAGISLFGPAPAAASLLAEAGDGGRASAERAAPEARPADRLETGGDTAARSGAPQHPKAHGADAHTAGPGGSPWGSGKNDVAASSDGSTRGAAEPDASLRAAGGEDRTLPRLRAHGPGASQAPPPAAAWGSGKNDAAASSDGAGSTRSTAEPEVSLRAAGGTFSAGCQPAARGGAGGRSSRGGDAGRGARSSSGGETSCSRGEYGGLSSAGWEGALDGDNTTSVSIAGAGLSITDLDHRVRLLLRAQDDASDLHYRSDRDERQRQQTEREAAADRPVGLALSHTRDGRHARETWRRYPYEAGPDSRRVYSSSASERGEVYHSSYQRARSQLGNTVPCGSGVSEKLGRHVFEQSLCDVASVDGSPAVAGQYWTFRNSRPPPGSRLSSTPRCEREGSLPASFAAPSEAVTSCSDDMEYRLVHEAALYRSLL
eukprot:gene9380-14545_t